MYIVLINPTEFKKPTLRKRKVTDIWPEKGTSAGISGGNGAIPEVEGHVYRLLRVKHVPQKKEWFEAQDKRRLNKYPF